MAKWRRPQRSDDLIRMKSADIPVTAALRVLRAARVAFEPCLYPYVERGGTRHAATCLGVPHHQVVKTLVFESEAPPARRRALLVLMHGDREVSAKNLARHLGVKAIVPASPETVEKYTGCLPGGVSPFGTRIPLPVYMERTIGDLETLYINGGKRGFLVRLKPADLVTLLKPEPVAVATGGESV